MCTCLDMERVHRPDAIANGAAGSRRENENPAQFGRGIRLRAFAVGLRTHRLGHLDRRWRSGAGSIRDLAGARGGSLPDWPRDCVIPIDGTHPTLLIFLHPHCPCSSASVDELREIIGRCGDRVRAHAVVLRTDSLEREGAGVIERSLESVPGIQIWKDTDAFLARHFGVLTSGHVMLYGPSGHLIYSGGITPSRGERGDNFGRSAVLAAILGDSFNRSSIPVFGCPLFDLDPTAAQEARP